MERRQQVNFNAVEDSQFADTVQDMLSIFTPQELDGNKYLLPYIVEVLARWGRWQSRGRAPAFCFEAACVGGVSFLSKIDLKPNQYTARVDSLLARLLAGMVIDEVEPMARGGGAVREKAVGIVADEFLARAATPRVAKSAQKRIKGRFTNQRISGGKLEEEENLPDPRRPSISVERRRPSVEKQSQGPVNRYRNDQRNNKGRFPSSPEMEGFPTNRNRSGSNDPEFGETRRAGNDTNYVDPVYRIIKNSQEGAEYFDGNSNYRKDNFPDNYGQETYPNEYQMRKNSNERGITGKLYFPDQQDYGQYKPSKSPMIPPRKHLPEDPLRNDETVAGMRLQGRNPRADANQIYARNEPVSLEKYGFPLDNNNVYLPPGYRGEPMNSPQYQRRPSIPGRTGSPDPFRKSMNHMRGDVPYNGSANARRPSDEVQGASYSRRPSDDGFGGHHVRRPSDDGNGGQFSRRPSDEGNWRNIGPAPGNSRPVGQRINERIPSRPKTPNRGGASKNLDSVIAEYENFMDKKDPRGQ